MKSILSLRFMVAGLLSLMVFVAVQTQAEEIPGFNPKRHMRYTEVEPGMKGYGLTVFHGTKIEAFPVEVVSVEQGFEAGKAVVWVRCPDDRMQLTGPVQGMSGSPIFLWPKGQTGENGKGGRMIGAFAFGFSLGKDCYVGIQPIEHMMEAAARRRKPDADRAERASGLTAYNTVNASVEVMQQLRLPEHESWRIEEYAKLLDIQSKPKTTNFDLKSNIRLSSNTSPQQLFRSNPENFRMMLPMGVGSPALASALKPFFKPFGLQPRPMAAGAATATPPKWIQPDQVKLEPGSVFSLPFVTGARDLGAIGTTTEVLPDGTVLAFGHAMNGQGPIVLPMATGYVHFIQPNMQNSFKVGNSLKVQGTLVHDENSAVIGTRVNAYKTLPVTVKLAYPEAGQTIDYQYKVAHHRPMLPSLIGAAIVGSLTANTTPPALSTIEYTAELKFAGDKSLTITDFVTSGNPAAILSQIASPIGLMVDNQFGVGTLTGVDVTVNIVEQRQVMQLAEMNIKKDTLAPGETFEIDLKLVPYRQKPITRTVRFKLPDDLPEGLHTISIADARSFARLKASATPHKTLIRSQEDIYNALQYLNEIKTDALYIALPSTEMAGVAIGREELPDLPSSKLAIVADRSSTRAAAYGKLYYEAQTMPYIPMGSATARINVRK